MNFDLGRLNRKRQILCIFKMLYCDILVIKKRKQWVLDKFKAKPTQSYWVFCSVWFLKQCVLSEEVLRPTDPHIVSALWSLITEFEATWTKCQGAQVSPLVEHVKSKFNFKSPKIIVE